MAAALVERLLDWLSDQADGCDSEAGDDNDEAEESARGRHSRDAAQLARAAGVSLEWHLITSPCCKATVCARLQHATNRVECAHCHVEFEW